MASVGAILVWQNACAAQLGTLGVLLVDYPIDRKVLRAAVPTIIRTGMAWIAASRSSDRLALEKYG